MFIKHLGKYLRLSYQKAYDNAVKRFSKSSMSEEDIEKFSREEAIELRNKELKDGIQTIQYQINTLLTSNG